jgi:hypothetical protein
MRVYKLSVFLLEILFFQSRQQIAELSEGLLWCVMKGGGGDEKFRIVIVTAVDADKFSPHVYDVTSSFVKKKKKEAGPDGGYGGSVGGGGVGGGGVGGGGVGGGAGGAYVDGWSGGTVDANLRGWSGGTISMNAGRWRGGTVVTNINDATGDGSATSDGDATSGGGAQKCASEYIFLITLISSHYSFYRL